MEPTPSELPKTPNVVYRHSETPSGLDDIADSLSGLSLSDEIKKEDLLQLLNPSEDKVKEVQQMLKEKMTEGQGETIYGLGIEENGNLKGITEEEFNKSLSNLKDIAKAINIDVSIVCERPGKTPGSKTANLLLR
eukprot:TRINITY_DN2841_c0_g1_i1.p3 TRINITY_DN2841_c0_g1~~TRINITY_DN2841_c0_g1_i1.p3  ORF type:complete len:135 (+),score=27.40 TRINITY_DN2841_c0_g1_i1:867-1271(+)